MSKQLRHLAVLLGLLGGIASGFGQVRPPDKKEVRPADARTAERDARRPGERDVRPGERDARPGEEQRPGSEKARPVEDARPLDRAKDARPGEEKSAAQTEARREQLKENSAKGREWETKTANYVDEQQGKASYQQVTIESQEGRRSRADLLYEKSDGSYALVEAKASDTASYTSNQVEVFDRITEGQQVTLRGEKVPGKNGEQITISEVWISRPGPNGEVKLERYKSAEVRAAGQ